MARLLKNTCPLAAEILEGKHDADLDFILQAATSRVKNRFRHGVQIKVVGTGKKEIDGKTGTVLKANTKTVTIGLGTQTFEDWDTDRKFGVFSDGEFNVSPRFLETVQYVIPVAAGARA